MNIMDMISLKEGSLENNLSNNKIQFLFHAPTRFFV